MVPGPKALSSREVEECGRPVNLAEHQAASDFVTLDRMEARETITPDARAQHRLYVLNSVVPTR